MRRPSSLFCAASALSILSGFGSARGAYFASSVISYTPGNIASLNQGYESPSSALGSPDGLTGVGTPYQGVLSPFNPAYDTDQIVVIGEGGSLTLKLAVPVKTSGGPSIGVISNVGLIDSNYPDGSNTDPASTFGGGAAELDVSQDGTTWKTVSTNYSFNLPANYYTDTGPYSPTPGTQTADFGKPFTGSLSDFDGQSYDGTLAVLNGSGGGTWIDLNATGMSEVNYVRFILPAYTGEPEDDPYNQLPIDAVAENSSLVDLSSVPEPTCLGMAAISLLLIGSRRRARNR